jgi:protein-tyrosine phosphatase
MVCLGNICRSPLAEEVMRDKIKKYGLKAEVDSCGIGAWHVGEPPDYRAQETALNHGLDISRQRCRQITFNDFNNFDVIYAMDGDIFNALLKKSAYNQNGREKVKLFMNELYPNENRPVPDPYCGGMEQFEEVWKMIDAGCEVIAKRNVVSTKITRNF